MKEVFFPYGKEKLTYQFPEDCLSGKKFPSFF